MNKLLLLTLIGAVLVSACIDPLPQTYERNETRVLDDKGGHLDVIKKCADKVICYVTNKDDYSKPLFCFRDADLVEKYCGVE